MDTRPPQRQNSSRPAGEILRPRLAALWWLALFGAWFVLVDSLAHPEVAAGPAAATIALVAVLGVSAHVRRQFRVQWRWLASLRHTPANIVSDTVTVFGALFRQLTGQGQMRGVLREVPFPATSRDDRMDAGWQAFATVGTSISPNTYIIGVDKDRHVALVHQLVATPPEQVRRAVIGSEPPSSDEQRLRRERSQTE